MPAFTSGACAPSNPRWVPTTSPEPGVDEQDDPHHAADGADDDLDHTLVDDRRPKTPQQAPAQVDQFSDPPESPEEFRMEVVKEQGITGFMLKVAVSQVARASSGLHEADEGGVRAG